jgi:hypothetical protein
MTEYSSHDWRKNTDDAVVVDEHDTVIRPVNDLKVRFKHPKSLKFEEVDVSRLIRVFCNNDTRHQGQDQGTGRAEGDPKG